MKKKYYLAILSLLISGLVFSQPYDRREKYNAAMDKVLYTIGYAHLDTQWNWDYPTTINEYIRNTMRDNFHLFEKYPDYVFNFTGSRRYHMMKEYYPEDYKKVVQYIKQGRWFVSGSSVDEGEANISSSESIIRQVLYGNDYFRKEFGTESCDYMLPDCFGFLANLPSIWHHCGLLGFSTQKLTWRSANGVPFNVGVWNGPDGKGIIAALNAMDYTGHVIPRLDLDQYWAERISQDISKYGISFDYRYYGVGDRGGSPRENDIKNAIGSLRNNDSKFKVILTSSDQMYKDITPEIRQKLPVYSGDLLLIEHSAGSMTSQSFMKRSNRKNELLAQSAEQLASFADLSGKAAYPFEKLNRAWELVLGSQFHDILPGTSIPKAYEYAWNDEFIAANGFAQVLKNSVAAIAKDLNTQTKGRTIVVYNPVPREREDVVTAEMKFQTLPEDVQVFDGKGKALPTQVISRNGNDLKFIFFAKVPSAGMAVYDVRTLNKQKVSGTTLSVTNETLENEFYKARFASNGDLVSLFDKKAQKELLSKPADLEFLHESPSQYPAWNMDWKDRQNPPVDFMNQDVSFRIVEQGPVRIALEITRKGRNSEIAQVYSLAAGEAGKCLEVTNKVDWQSKGVSLKAAFPLAVNNENATYNLGVGTIQRGNNNERKFEVPSKEWFDLTDKSGKYGVSILEDCKFGSDKPDDNTLRLTLLYTPEVNQNNRSFIYQNTQDWGIHDIRYAIYGHAGDWCDGQSPWKAKFFNQPLLAFETTKHSGKSGKELSLISISSPEAGLMAFKKMENGDYYIVRVNELYGKDAKGIQISFPNKIVDAYEVNGQEQKIGDVSLQDGKLNFDLSHYTIRSFAVKFQNAAETSGINNQVSLDLPFDRDVMSFDDNRDDGNFEYGLSLPAELIPDEITSEDVHFKMGGRQDGQNNAVACNGQKINLPQGSYNKLYILAAATDDVQKDFNIDNQPFTLGIQKWTGYVGQFYNRHFTPDMSDVIAMDKPFAKKDNIAWFASHRHISYPSQNDAYQYSYIYKYEIDLPKKSKTLTLPSDKKIKVFAITLAKNNEDNVKALDPLFDEFQGNKPFELRAIK
ncbi:MAG: glycoside hydrolase family 38 C-terminal domain-containing protein [Bacteroidota bacterium]|nr:glycoside hydrolase family 38 C-terminal domain-containing protein [Bacteroidota bacterium]